MIDSGADADAAWLTAALDYDRRDDRLAVFPFRHTLEWGCGSRATRLRS